MDKVDNVEDEEQTTVVAKMTSMVWPSVVTAIAVQLVIIMVTQHIPTMTKSHHGGEVSVMMKVGMCQCQKPTKHHTP